MTERLWRRGADGAIVCDRHRARLGPVMWLLDGPELLNHADIVADGEPCEDCWLEAHPEYRQVSEDA